MSQLSIRFFHTTHEMFHSSQNLEKSLPMRMVATLGSTAIRPLRKKEGGDTMYSIYSILLLCYPMLCWADSKQREEGGGEGRETGQRRDADNFWQETCGVRRFIYAPFGATAPLCGVTTTVWRGNTVWMTSRPHLFLSLSLGASDDGATLPNFSRS